MQQSSEPVTITRAYVADLEAGDGRTILGRCVPYDSPRTVADPPDFLPYLEVFRRGAFRRSTKAAHRVLLNYEHQLELGSQVGHAVELIETDTGLDAVFRAFDNDRGEQALELIRAGVCRGLSVQCSVPPSGSRLGEGGIVERTMATLVHVAITATPAYPEALITATRSGEPATSRLSIAEIRRQQAHLRGMFTATQG